MGRENADRVIADLYGVAFSPDEQPLQLTVTEQSLGAEVPDENTAYCYNPYACVWTLFI